MAQSKKTKKAIDAELNKMMRGDVEVMEQYFITHWRLIVIVGVVLVALIAAAIGMTRHADAEERAGMVELNSAETLDQLAAALRKYPDNPASGVNGFRLAKLYAEARNPAECLAAVNAALALTQEDNLLARRLESATYMEIAGDADQARRILQSLLNESGLAIPQRIQALYTLGRLASDVEQKREYFTEAAGISTRDGIGVHYVSLAKFGLAELEQKQ